MADRLICLAIGYALGCVLTAEFVCRRAHGESAFATGDGNPGMANVAHALGVKRGIAVLAGDIAKTLVAAIAVRILFPDLGMLAPLWATVGAALGHNFPVWHRFRGGKGVTVTCAGLILSSPVAGIVSCLAGLAGCAISGYLCVGAIVIPAAYLAIMAAAALGWAPGAAALGIDPQLLTAASPAGWAEPLALAAILLALMVLAHGGPVLAIKSGKTPKARLFRRDAR